MSDNTNTEWDLSIKYQKLGAKLFNLQRNYKLPIELQEERRFVFEVLTLLDQNISSRKNASFFFNTTKFVKQLESMLGKDFCTPPYIGK